MGDLVKNWVFLFLKGEKNDYIAIYRAETIS